MKSSNHCSQEFCNFPDTSCHLGEPAGCAHYKASASSDEGSQLSAIDGLRLAWTGLAMGHTDVAYVVGRQKPFVVGIFGPENAGKTSLLGAWYLLIGKGLLSSIGWAFAGSRSIEGWEGVASGLRWVDAQRPPKFPAHTSSRSGRSPGLLHLTLQDNMSSKRNFLFTDAPGEWFTHWTNNVDSSEAAGARWVAENSDVLLIAADSEALGGANKGIARHELQSLISRVAGIRNKRPVALVWMKSDINVTDAMRSSISGVARMRIPDIQEFDVNVVDGHEVLSETGLFRLLRWVLNSRRRKAALPPIEGFSDDPLFLFGSR